MKIWLTFLAFIPLAGNAYWPVGEMLGYDMPFGSVLVGMLSLLLTVILVGVTLIWRQPAD